MAFRGGGHGVVIAATADSAWWVFRGSGHCVVEVANEKCGVSRRRPRRCHRRDGAGFSGKRPLRGRCREFLGLLLDSHGFGKRTTAWSRLRRAIPRGGRRVADHDVVEVANSQVYCSIPVVSGSGPRRGLGCEEWSRAVGLREADHRVVEAANSRACADSGREKRGQCPGRWRRWTLVARSLRIQDILSIGPCSRVVCHDKLSPGWLQPCIPGRCRRRPEVAEVAYGREL